MESLVGAYKRIGLNLEVLDRPLVGVSNQDIFQMGIESERGRPVERFRFWHGHRDNQIHVVNLNRDWQQAVLFVREPKRVFTLSEHLYGAGDRSRKELDEFARSRGGVFVRVHGRNRVEVQCTTPDAKRHYLTGMDECHYFISELPRGVSTVRQAHEALKPSTLTAVTAYVRQGEYFFTEVRDRNTRSRIQSAARLELKKHEVIGRYFGLNGGNPHAVDELVTIGTGIAQDVFVRGCVKHPEHRPRYFTHWMQVTLNREVRQAPSTFSRFGSWVD